MTPGEDHLVGSKGGPAFPNECATTVHGRAGMSLRDYFAAKAMQGWLATFTDSRHPTENGGAQDFARRAYALADEMIKARDEGGAA